MKQAKAPESGAIRIPQPFNATERFAQDVAEIRRVLPKLRNRSDAELVRDTDQLAAAAEISSTEDDPALDNEQTMTAIALAAEALRRARHIEMYDVQIAAALVLAHGHVAEMQTGEGKTFSAMPAAAAHAITGRGVHVVTPNTYLAERDYELAAPVFARLGMTVGLLPERDAPPADKRAAYACSATYGTGYEFGFDYLRDQLLLRKQTQRPLGETVLSRLRGEDTAAAVVQRGLNCAIVDEIDNVLIDDACSPLILSVSAAGEAADASAVRTARLVAEQLDADVHYELRHSGRSVHLTPDGLRRIYEDDIAIPMHALQQSWTEYVEQALRAAILFFRDIHYVITDGEIQIVDTSTGRIFADRTWQDGLHQAIEAKEGLPITPDTSVMAQVTKQRFFRLYSSMCGMTGTADHCEREFASVYNLGIGRIALRRPSQRELLRTRFFSTAEAKWTAIAEEVAQIHQTGRPVLVGTRSILDSEQLAERLRSRGLSAEVLNGRQDRSEAEVVAAAGQGDALTIATSLAGRGTDIQLDEAALAAGGLHVIVTEPHDSWRIDRQLIGRCGRQGNPGSARVFVSAEDELLTRHGPWLCQVLRRDADANGEVFTDIQSALNRIQNASERTQIAVRRQLLQQDISRGSLFEPGARAEAG